MKNEPVDRTGWPQGPWDTEPDFVEWVSSVGGIDVKCEIQRNSLGALCGYVYVPKKHPWRKAHRAVDVEGVSVHGGITWGVDSAGRIGFDCSHAGDDSPGMRARGRRKLLPGETYRDMAYVRGEVENLATQLRRDIGCIVEHYARAEAARESSAAPAVRRRRKATSP
jgi:hypothetical protein